jgi:hypothetical protein
MFSYNLRSLCSNAITLANRAWREINGLRHSFLFFGKHIPIRSLSHRVAIRMRIHIVVNMILLGPDQASSGTIFVECKVDQRCGSHLSASLTTFVVCMFVH